MSRIKDLRKKRGLTQQQIANVLGISQSNYSYWESGKVKIDENSLKKLALYYDVSVDYLLGIKENILSIYPVGQQTRIPVLGYIHAGNPIYAEEHIEGYELADARYGQGHFYFRVEGDSMLPNIPHGALVLIRQQEYAE